MPTTVLKSITESFLYFRSILDLYYFSYFILHFPLQLTSFQLYKTTNYPPNLKVIETSCFKSMLNCI